LSFFNVIFPTKFALWSSYFYASINQKSQDMIIEQIYTGCLAEAAYYIESEGEVAIIDPLREFQPYIDRANESGAKIKYVLETHFHADFVSGHLDLARKTGATIVFGPTAQPNYDAHIAQDGEMLELGSCHIKVLHTPGHTMESTTFLLIDEEGTENAIFTGDTLFIGDVGRPDLAVKSDLSREDLAGHLFDSLRNKIMTLPDDVIVNPGHGKGSACGKKMSDETLDTLGNQKRTNYALRADMTRDEFIKEVTDGLVAPPQYFPKNAVMNKQGYETFDDVIERGVKGLTVDEFLAVYETGNVIILDTRLEEEYREGHIPDSLFIGLEGSFASWVGTLVDDLDQKFLFIADEGREEEVVTRLARVGYDYALGYLKGGMETWKAAGQDIGTVDYIDVKELEDKINSGPINYLDVRKESEYNAEHVVDSQNLPLDFIWSRMHEVNPDETYYVSCQGGYRSLIAISIFRHKGFKHLIDVRGGFDAVLESDIPRTEYICPTTEL
jgi:glyoxylase-like metal-dependent hydrolase (beta-lactamase superfamily II)/rhodanese-related sulfurtransferase